MNNNFDEVSTDIINLLTNLHYEDKEKEIVKLSIVYILCKMLQTEKTFNEDIKVLDKNAKRLKK